MSDLRAYAELESLKADFKKLQKKLCAMTEFYDTFEAMEEAVTTCCSGSLYIVREGEGAGMYICVDGELTSLPVDITPINAADIADGSISNTEFQFLNNVSANIQAQINSKEDVGHTHVIADITDFPIISSGVFTPNIGTFLNLDNVVPVGDGQYTRVGDVVTFSMGFVATATSNARTMARLDIPLAVNAFTTLEEAAGTGAPLEYTNASPMSVYPNVGDVQVLIEWEDTDFGNPHTWFIHCTYLIIQ